MTSLVCLYRIPSKYSILCPENFNFLLLSASVVDLEYCFVFLSTRDSYLRFFYVIALFSYNECGVLLPWRCVPIEKMIATQPSKKF